MAKKKTEIIEDAPKKVHLAKMIPVSLLAEHPHNSNVQSKHVFNELRESIREHGFDEPAIVVPRDDGQPGFFVVSGNHRVRAGKEEGYEELPAIIREDWDKVTQEIELVRRNYVRGAIDRTAFTESVNRLSSEQNLALSLIMEKMGFEDETSFADFYKAEKQKEKTFAAASVAAQGAAQGVKMLDDIGIIVSTLMEKYGNTAIPNSFLIFPLGGRNHMYVSATPALKNAMDAVALKCVAEGLNVNTVLGGLLTIGLHQLNSSKVTKEEVVKQGSVEGDDNLNPAPKKGN